MHIYGREIYGGVGGSVRTGLSETQGAGPLEAGNSSCLMKIKALVFSVLSS